jgi:crotonobetainyl-CoA:carnitine CoA-transferase CaiB-like acyl-CoA transferase
MTEPVTGSTRAIAGGALPLSDLRVLELGRLLAAPLAGQILGDLGAEVVKVERPHAGDEFRRYGLVFVKDDEGGDSNLSAIFTSVNRNKRSITVDLEHPDGRSLVRDLAKNCDILIQNFKVGALEKFGLDYDSLRAIHPGIIYLSTSGFGMTGPYAAKPATDGVFQAMSGLMSVTGEPDQEPMRSGSFAVDYSGGLFGVISLLAALRHRDRTGEGQQIDLSLLDCGIATLASRSCDYLIGDVAPGRAGNRNPGAAPAQLFRCADGHISVQAPSDRLFALLCKILKRPDIADDPRFATPSLRLRNVAALSDLLDEAFTTRTGREWFEELSAAGMIAGPTYDVAQCFADPQVQARGMRVSIPRPSGGPIDVVANPMRFSATPIETYAAPPELGEGVDDVLSAWLGYDPDQISRLRATGAV